MPGGVRERMERVSGADFSPVRVHVDAEADRLNDALGSRAFTVGADVFVRRSEYRPGTARGDALLGHELTHTIQQGAARSRSAGPAVATPTVQRLFGFELELGVPLFSRVNGVEGYPRMKTPRIATANDRSFEVHVDHNADVAKALPDEVLVGRNRTAAIVELVTRPMNELTETEQQVERVMQNLTDVADHISTQALQPNTDTALDGLPGVAANPAGVNFVGHQVAPDEQGRLSVDASVQATFGLSLKQVGDEFKARATGPKSTRNSYNDSMKYLHDAARIGETLVDRIRRELHDEERDGRYGDEGELREADGLLTLIAYYLLIGKAPQMTGLLKNQTGIFYFKTKLSTVRNTIAGPSSMFPWLSASYRALVRRPGLALLFREKRADLVNWLLYAADRTADEPVFHDLEAQKSDVTCSAWIDSVLRGKRDQIFEVSVNMYSGELKAPDVGGGEARGHGVVLENRRFAETLGKDYSHRYPPGEWPGLASDLRRSLLERQGQ